uniref:Plasmid replication initiation protein n=1 Tax=Mycoplasma cottewii TaxID=51364 RepID=K9S0F4_9MOLU|nr:replication protein [Mycoplasma cottewii]AFY63028.1 plasmid replication initiation protein [Mycoplasma cottewii]
MRTNIKKRFWTLLVYPDSAPIEWKDILIQNGVEFFGALHDKDINPDGTLKKPHYHIVLVYSGPTTFNNVKTLCNTLNSPKPLPLDGVGGMWRYMTHKDNPEKYQYDDSIIFTGNGFDISNYKDLSKKEISIIKQSLLDLIDNELITEYSVFVRRVRQLGIAEAFDVAANNTIFFNNYIISFKFDLKKKAEQEYEEMVKKRE